MAWNAETNIKGPPGLTGPPGPKGDTGDQGPPGEVAEAPIDGQQYARKNAAWTTFTSGGGSAVTVTFTPAGNLAATNVQAALVELDNEKVAKAGDTMTGPLVMPGNGTAAATSINFGAAGTGIIGNAGAVFVATGGGLRLNIGNSQFQTTVPLSVPTGAANATSISFGTNVTGIYGTTTTISAAVAGNNKSTLTATDLTLTVPVVLPANPTTALQAAPKQYVDATAKVFSNKNYIVNGAMMVSQENGTAPLTASGTYPVDQFRVSFSNTGTQTFQQANVYSPAGSVYRLRVTCTVADASVAASDYCTITQPIEGIVIADLQSGRPLAKTVTLQFGVKAPAGTYCVALRNGTVDRSYVAEYVISAGEANTDVVKSVTIQLDTSGSWVTYNILGMYVTWTLMSGTATNTTAGSWTAGSFFGTANQFNFMGTINNVFELFDVSLTEGTVAPPFKVPDYADELLACQRYWQQVGMGATGSWTGAGGAQVASQFPVAMRANPTALLTTTSPNIIEPGVALRTATGAALTLDYVTTKGSLCGVTGFTGATLGKSAIMTSDYIKLNARL
jgi:hypothetical protein